MRYAILLIALAVSTSAAQTPLRSDSVIVSRALEAVKSYQQIWRGLWLSSLQTRARRMNHVQGPNPHNSLATPARDPRTTDAMCYWPNLYVDHMWGIDPKLRRIHSEAAEDHWVCPNWLPPDDYYLTQARLPDERLGIDNALEPSLRKRATTERRALIHELGLAVAEVPHDSALVGQYVRMLVDNHDFPGALSAATDCAASPSWCAALRGYVLHMDGNTAAADSAFRESLATRESDDRCTFTRLGALLDDDVRSTYNRMSCAEQDSMNRRIWWLADPLWSVEGNDRMTEQFARKVTIALHAALGRDERYNWMRMGGGDALTEMIERYGWMSFAGTKGTYPTSVRFPSVRRGAYGGYPRNYEEKLAARALGGYQTTYEYSIGRVHVIPPASMVRDPFEIRNEDWSMNAPAGTSWDDTFNWWPTEHYAPVHELIKLRDQQTVFLRRQDRSMLAYSTPLAYTDINRRLGDSVTGAFVVSTGPDALNVVERRSFGAQDRMTFLVPLPRAPAMVSVEVPWGANGERAGRSRFGVKPPPPLSEMRATDVAISDPLIMAVPAGATALPNVADSAVKLMHGSTQLAAGANGIGVYWETYGIASTDTVEITVSVQRKGGIGILDRVTSAVGARSSSSGLVSASWTEPQGGHPVGNVPGAVPIQMRSVILDIRALPAGTYTLEISAKRRGSSAVKSSREFTIR